MDLKELRIGNYINVPKTNQIANITAIADTLKIIGVQVNNNILANLNQDEIKPILLTEEWAIKFSYECLVEMACDFSSESIFDIEITSEDIKRLSVHTAQNLYFALTGKELEIS